VAASNHPYTAAEIARAMGHRVDWFYNNYVRLVSEEGMPARLVNFGRYRFHRARMDAWLAGRREISAPIANDDAPLAPSIEQERDQLARIYGAA